MPWGWCLNGPKEEGQAGFQGQGQATARGSASAAPKLPPNAKKTGGVVHAGLDGDLDVEVYAKGLLQEADHTPEG